MAKTKQSVEKISKEESKVKSDLPGFDIEEFRAQPLKQIVKTRKLITTIPVTRPNKQKWFKVHPGMVYPAYVLVWEEDGTSYLVHPRVLQSVSGLVKFVHIHVAMYYSPSLSQNIFLIPVPQPDSEGKWNSWYESLNVAVAIAKQKWTRLVPNKDIQGYDVIDAEGDLGEPEWPELSIEQILSIAFKNKQITEEDHPKLKELRGLE